MIDALMLMALASIAVALYFARQWLPKAIQHQFDAKFESINSSINLLATTHSDKKRKEIEAIESLYKSMLKANNEYSSLLFCDSILLPDEIQKIIVRQDPSSSTYKMLSEYSHESIAEKTTACQIEGTESLFVTEKLIGFQFRYVQVLGRAAVLIAMSLEDSNFRNWRDDKPFMEQILSGIDETLMRKASKLKTGGLRYITDYITAGFIVEAKRCIDGSEEKIESVLKLMTAMQTDIHRK